MRYAGEGPDPYCYPDTGVLKNIPGILDKETLQQFETEISQWEQARIELTPVEGTFDLSHLREIHRRLFQQVYEWAGAIRTGNISRDDTLFANHGFIESYATEVFNKLPKNGNRGGEMVRPGTSLSASRNTSVRSMPFIPSAKATDAPNGFLSPNWPRNTA